MCHILSPVTRAEFCAILHTVPKNPEISVWWGLVQVGVTEFILER